MGVFFCGPLYTLCAIDAAGVFVKGGDILKGKQFIVSFFTSDTLPMHVLWTAISSGRVSHRELEPFLQKVG